ncbi:MAG: hypothetical protein WAZ98_05720, partial [Cyclobacteriaceae bacterium]
INILQRDKIVCEQMRNNSVYTKKIRDFDFSKFSSPNRKKIRASRDWCHVAQGAAKRRQKLKKIRASRGI